ncbi:hypothetical protein ACTHPF_26815 [Paenibacillus sp. SAF-054]|uniref:hypothetical protein n=1 Tax=unclassified Paenibacillus TaxID=185978 RepID=UPI003F7FCAC5
MAKQIERIQVTFNVLDPDQQRLYEYVYGKTNSSGYVKRLIQREMDGGVRGGREGEMIPMEIGQRDDDDFNLGGFI